MFLEVANAADVKPVSGVPDLMLGEGWQKAQLQPNVFLHGGRFDSGDWKLSLNFREREQMVAIRQRKCRSTSQIALWSR